MYHVIIIVSHTCSRIHRLALIHEHQLLLIDEKVNKSFVEKEFKIRNLHNFRYEMPELNACVFATKVKGHHNNKPWYDRFTKSQKRK